LQAPIVFEKMTLVLGRAKRYFGIGGKDDYTVLDGGRVIEGIFLSPHSPLDRNSMWSITSREYPPTIHGRKNEYRIDLSQRILTARTKQESALCRQLDITVKRRRVSRSSA